MLPSNKGVTDLISSESLEIHINSVDDGEVLTLSSKLRARLRAPQESVEL